MQTSGSEALQTGRWPSARASRWATGASRQRKGAGEHRAFIGDPAWTDFTVETKATLNQGNGYGVHFRSSAPKGDLPTRNATTNSLVFHYDPGLGGRFVFRRVTAGSESAPFASVDVKNTTLGGPGWIWRGQNEP